MSHRPRTDHLRLIAAFVAAIGCTNVQADCDEVGYIATFDVKPGQESAFEQAILAVAAKVRAVEPGTLLYAPFRGENNQYYMMERYGDLAAREAHAKAPEVLALFAPVMAALATPIQVEAVAAVCAPEAEDPR